MGWRPMASERLFPSVTSVRSWRLTSEGIPLELKLAMLWRAAVRGMPAFSRFANCWV
jgi:hypothetical protein